MRCGTSHSGVPSAATSAARLPERKRLGLREDVRDEQVVVAPERVEARCEADEVARDQPRALVDQLVEAVLPVRPRLAPEDRAGVDVDRRRVDPDALAVRLHRQLLEVGGEPLEVLVVRQHGDGLRVEEVRVPDGEQPHQHRQVLGERRRAEVLVHRVEAAQHPGEAVGADREHRREADRGVHRVAAADPVPEPERVGGVDPERRHVLRGSSRRRRSGGRSRTRHRRARRAASRAPSSRSSSSRAS